MRIQKHFRTILFLAFLIVCSSVAVAQESQSKASYAAYIEAGGQGVLYSANMEVQLIRPLALRAGFTVLPLADRTISVVPLSATALLGAGPHHFETGIGASIGMTSDSDARFISPIVGYRYQSIENGLVFRATLCPLVRMNDFSEIIPWGGLSIGYAWK